MGKATKDKNKVIDKKAEKAQMKKVLDQLAQNKLQNAEKIQRLTPIAQLHITEAKNKVQKRKAKRVKRKESDDLECQQNISQSQMEVEEPVADEPVNIFAVDKFEAQSYRPEIVEWDLPAKAQLSVEDEAKRKLGLLNFGVFGLKPLKNPGAMTNQVDEVPTDIINNPELAVPSGTIKVVRDQQLQQFRQKLPISAKEQEIVETINYNLVTLICGETGSGKSTQIPQFLYEKNYTSLGKIAVTQPRRLAATALSQRVAEELNVKLGKEVSYQVRHQKMLDQELCRIKFMTDGILLNEMVSDCLLKKYSVVIIDQAHERKVNTDLLVGLLSQIIKIRYKMSMKGLCHPLRLVIMSATMRVEDFNNENLFQKKPPIVRVEARMFPVTVFFSKRTPQDYIKEAVRKCVQIHKKLPAGDVLVFLTGKEQIKELSILLEQALERSIVEEEEEYEKQDDNLPAIEESSQQMSYCIMQLYSSLPLAEQNKIFQETPNKRKFIISTNIAETSLTIPNIRYVIDSGFEKYKHFDKVWKWYKGWGTRAMAQQRAGRAGRVAHGYCYRLYSTAVYSNTMKLYPEPEITKIPLESMILQLKAIGVHDTLMFPYPTQPDKQKIMEAINNLLEMQALKGELDRLMVGADKTHLTELGRVLSFIPLEPLYGKMLLMARQKGVPQYMLLCVLALTVETILAHSMKMTRSTEVCESEDEEEDLKKLKKKADMRRNLLKQNIQDRHSKIAEFKQLYGKYYSKGSDIFLIMNILGEMFSTLMSQKQQHNFNLDIAIRQYCQHNRLLENAVKEVYRNSEQIIDIYHTMTDQQLHLEQYSFPRVDQIDSLLDIFLQSYSKNVCQLQNKAQYVNRQGLQIHIHPSSYLYTKTPLFVGYFETFQTSRAYMRYPFEVRNYSLLATFGQTQPCHDYVWNHVSGLIGIAKATLGEWQIPPFMVSPVTQEIQWYQIARMLLDGTILPSFKQLKSLYNADPKIIRQDNVSQKVQRLVNCLKSRNMRTRESILGEFRRDPQLLKNELRLWIERGQTLADYDKLYLTLRNNIQQAH